MLLLFVLSNPSGLKYTVSMVCFLEGMLYIYMYIFIYLFCFIAYCISLLYLLIMLPIGRYDDAEASDCKLGLLQ